MPASGRTHDPAQKLDFGRRRDREIQAEQVERLLQEAGTSGALDDLPTNGTRVTVWHGCRVVREQAVDPARHVEFDPQAGILIIDGAIVWSGRDA